MATAAALWGQPPLPGLDWGAAAAGGQEPLQARQQQLVARDKPIEPTVPAGMAHAQRELLAGRVRPTS